MMGSLRPALLVWCVGCAAESAPDLGAASPPVDGGAMITDAAVARDAEPSFDAEPMDAMVIDLGMVEPAGTASVTVAPAPPPYWIVESLPIAFEVGGENVTHYRHRLDGAAWASEAAVGTALSIAEAAPGWRLLEISGRNADGEWQTTPLSVRFYLTATGPEITACRLVSEGGECGLIVEPSDTEKRYYATNNVTPYGWETVLAPTPGAKLCLAAGRHRTIIFRGLVGTPEAPLTIINCDGRAEVRLGAGDNGVAIGFERSRYFRLVGNGSTDAHGILVDASPGGGGNNAIELAVGSSDYEVAHVEVSGANYAGIAARTNVSCEHNSDNFVQASSFFHHNHVHNTPGEAFYIGGSHWAARVAVAANPARCGVEQGNGTVLCDGTCRFEAELHGVRVYSNRVEDIESDGIQVSSARGDTELGDGSVDWDTEIHHNVVRRAAIGNSAFNSGAMSIQGGTNGRVYANLVEGTTAFAGMFISTLSLVAYNNIIRVEAQLAMAIQDNEPGGFGGPFIVVDNTFITGGGSENFYMFHEHSTGNLLANNLIIGGLRPVRRNSPSVDLTEADNLIVPTPVDLVDAAAGDYHLINNSAAIGAGQDTSRFGVVVDYYGTPRVAPYDIGAVAH